VDENGVEAFFQTLAVLLWCAAHTVDTLIFLCFFGFWRREADADLGRAFFASVRLP
jgi:hypothetical protein